MELILLTFLMLAFIGLGLTVFLGIRSFKKRISWIKSFIFIALYGIFCIGILVFLIERRAPKLIKRIPVIRTIEAKQSCDCTWSSLSLEKDDFSAKHKPAAQRISNQMYIRNEALRQKWIKQGRLVPVEEMEGFGISKLDFSTAHLTPLAKKRLYELGKRFRASIQNPDEKMSYFMVSSITRSQLQQTQICERYPTACTKDHSPHSYGVAFDIYRLHSRYKNCNVGMKALENVLQEMQEEGKILLCTESKCIHVTVCG